MKKNTLISHFSQVFLIFSHIKVGRAIFLFAGILVPVGMITAGILLDYEIATPSYNW